MSEPHKLEERAANTVFDLIAHGDASHREWLRDKSAEVGRAVLVLVREEQTKSLYGHVMGLTLAGWWLSHTAKETGNG